MPEEHPPYRDVEPTDAFGNPIVGRIGPFSDRHVMEARMGAWAYPAVAHDINGKLMTVGDAFDLGLHGTGIGIDKDRQQGRHQLYFRLSQVPQKVWRTICSGRGGAA